MNKLVHTLSRGWYAFARILGHINISILLGLTFFVIVTPVALCRRLWGKDSLRLKQFKKDTESTLVHCAHLFTKEDLTDTF